jgi:hypothetical protein
MQAYDSRQMTLDPGLTALALRGLHHADGHYPFIERHTRMRRWRVAAVRQVLAAWLPTIHSLAGAQPRRPRGGDAVASPPPTDR